MLCGDHKAQSSPRLSLTFCQITNTVTKALLIRPCSFRELSPVGSMKERRKHVSHIEHHHSAIMHFVTGRNPPPILWERFSRRRGENKLSKLGQIWSIAASLWWGKLPISKAVVGKRKKNNAACARQLHYSLMQIRMDKEDIRREVLYGGSTAAQTAPRVVRSSLWLAWRFHQSNETTANWQHPAWWNRHHLLACEQADSSHWLTDWLLCAVLSSMALIHTGKPIGTHWEWETSTTPEISPSPTWLAALFTPAWPINHRNDSDCDTSSFWQCTWVD